jgi:uncharacterized protein (TIGR02118 family)
MLKRITVFSLAEGTNSDEYWKYHTAAHASDVLKALPRPSKYVINRVTRVVSGEPKFWGFVETWWDSEEAMNQAMNTPELKQANADWLPRVSGCFTALVEEKVI